MKEQPLLGDATLPDVTLRKFWIFFKFNKRSPEQSDFVVIIKIDGRRVHKAFVKTTINRRHDIRVILTRGADGKVRANKPRFIAMASHPHSLDEGLLADTHVTACRSRDDRRLPECWKDRV